MTVSVFDLFKIGVGPSSSHTVGPMRAGLDFARELKKLWSEPQSPSSSIPPAGSSFSPDAQPQPTSPLHRVEADTVAEVVTPDAPQPDGLSIRVILYGSLAATGAGHGTLGACLLGLDGSDPATVDPDFMVTRLQEIRRNRLIYLAGDRDFPVQCGFEDIILRPAVRRSIHTNAVTFVALGAGSDNTDGASARDNTDGGVCGTTGGAGSDNTDGASARDNTDGGVYGTTGGTGGHTEAAKDVATAGNTDGGVGEEGGAHPAHGSWKQTYYSIGGGFIRTEDEQPTLDDLNGGYSFDSAEKLLNLASKHGCGLAAVQRECEREIRSDQQINDELDAIAQAMDDCFKRGVTFDGVLPGSLHVRRRAKRWYDQLMEEDPARTAEFSEDWVNLVALSVNEENAAGGRVVTAPTNGAAGIIPAVMFYAREFTHAGRENPREVNRRFLLAAGAVGSLYKERASISGAEVGCQGEVGSAASMAAAGLAEILGGSPAQVANAAEIAMEHSLGLTCDPIGGLVQIPCIERNAISAGKAINAAKMALRGDGQHHVTLDEVIETMRQTGEDMNHKYKETAGGGLATNVAVNVPEC